MPLKGPVLHATVGFDLKWTNDVRKEYVKELVLCYTQVEV